MKGGWATVTANQRAPLGANETPLDVDVGGGGFTLLFTGGSVRHEMLRAHNVVGSDLNSS